MGFTFVPLVDLTSGKPYASKGKIAKLQILNTMNGKTYPPRPKRKEPNTGPTILKYLNLLTVRLRKQTQKFLSFFLRLKDIT